MKMLIEKYNIADRNGSLFDTKHVLKNYQEGSGLIGEEQVEQQAR